MRFMMLVIPKGYETAAADTMPDPEMVAAMDKYNTDLQQSGVLRAMDSLHPPAVGARVTFPGGKPVVKDGPFAEAKEVLGGYWIIEVASKQDAIDWAKRCPGDDNMTIEIRQMHEWNDFTPEVQAAAPNEPALRAALEKKA